MHLLLLMLSLRRKFSKFPNAEVQMCIYCSERSSTHRALCSKTHEKSAIFGEFAMIFSKAKIKVFKKKIIHPEPASKRPIVKFHEIFVKYRNKSISRKKNIICCTFPHFLVYCSGSNSAHKLVIHSF